jgi:phage tail sheath protein FI
MSSPPRIDGVATSTTGLVGLAPQGLLDQPVLVTSLAEYEQAFGGPQAGHDLFLGAKLYFDNGGRRAWVVRLAGQGQAAIGRGLAALDAIDDLGLLCLPGLSGGQVLATAAKYARSRRTFYVAEAAGTRAATLAAVRAIRAADRGHTAVWLPRLEIATARFGPSAAIAGLLARTDVDRGVWAFPEGALQGVTGVATAIDQHGAALLRRDGVNAVRRVPGHGIRSWGARPPAAGRTPARSGSTSRSAGWRSTWRRASTAGSVGRPSSPTTNRPGPGSEPPWRRFSRTRSSPERLRAGRRTSRTSSAAGPRRRRSAISRTASW